MPLSFARGSVQWLTSQTLGTTIVVTGLGFQPKGLRFTWTGIQNAANGFSTALDMRAGVGFATGIADRRCVGIFADDDSGGGEQSASIARNDSVVVTVDLNAATTGLLDLSAIGADGFTLIVDDVTPANITVNWEAWGGTDITVQVVGDISEPAATGTQNYTVTGFAADGVDQVVMFAGCQSTAALNTGTNNDGGLMVGFATSTSGTNQVVGVGNTDDGSDPSDTSSYARSGECLAMQVIGDGNPSARANLSAWGTNQFTLNWTARASTGRKYIYLAIKGGKWRAGAYTINGSVINNTTTVSGLGFQPAGIVGFSIDLPESAAGTVSNDAIFSFGSARSTTDRGNVGGIIDHAQDPTVVGLVVQYDSFLAVPNPGAVKVVYDISNISTDGFTVIADTAGGNAAAAQFYLAGGNVSNVTPTPTPTITRTPTPTPTITPTRTVTPTITPTPTLTPTITPTNVSQTPTPTLTLTPSFTPSPTATTPPFSPFSYTGGSFQWLTSDTLNSTKVFTGFGFQPKALKFYWSGMNTTPGTSASSHGVDNLNAGIGFAASNTSRRSVGIFTENSVSPTNCGVAVVNTAVVVTVDGGGTINGQLDISSFDADGFTLIVDDVVPQSITINFEAWGGSDITNVTIGDIAEPAATGTQNYTGVAGFTSDGVDQCVMFAGSQQTNAVNSGQATDSGIMFGWATSTNTAQKAVITTSYDDAASPPEPNSYSVSGETIAMMPVNPATGAQNPNARATLSAWGTSQFTLNWLARALTNRRYFYMAIKGGKWVAGSTTINSNTVGNTSTVSSLPMNLKGLSFFTMSDDPSPAGSGGIDFGVWCLGQAKSTTSRASQSFYLDTLASNVVSVSARYDSVMAQVALSLDTYDVILDLSEMTSDSFTVIVDDFFNFAELQYFYLAAGGPVASSYIPKFQTIGHPFIF